MTGNKMRAFMTGLGLAGIIICAAACGAEGRGAQSHSADAGTTQEDMDAIVEKKVQEQLEIDRRVKESVAAAKADGSYILPFSSERLVTNEDLAPLTSGELRLARNELYAKHGRIYESKDLNDYFSAQSWYQPSVTADQWSDSLFSSIEEQNVLRILGYERYGDVAYSDHPEDPYYYGNSEDEDTYDGYDGTDAWQEQQSYAAVQTQPAAPVPDYERDGNGGYAKYSFKAGGSFDGRTQLSNGNYLYSSINVMTGNTDIECPVSTNAMYGTVIASGVYYDKTSGHYFASNVTYDPGNGGTLYFSN